MEDIKAVRRQLKIKAGVVKRLDKEHALYKREAGDQQKKLDKFIADGAEDWDVGNATRMMDEANRMITDSAVRLGNAAEELRGLVVRSKKISELADAEELSKAEEVLKETTSA